MIHVGAVAEWLLIPLGSMERCALFATLTCVLPLFGHLVFVHYIRIELSSGCLCEVNGDRQLLCHCMVPILRHRLTRSQVTERHHHQNQMSYVL